MENKDRPAFPVTKDMGYTDTGLTKREFIAGLVMQGLMSATNRDGDWTHDIKSAVEISIETADELLKQLKEQ